VKAGMAIAISMAIGMALLSYSVQAMYFDFHSHFDSHKASAQSLLTDYSTLAYVEVLVHPDDVDKSYEQRRKKPRALDTKGNTSNLFPNPASDYVVYKPMTGKAVGSIMLRDSQGRILPADYNERSLLVINVSNFSNGIYTLQVYSDDGELLDASEFIIQR
jgi:hypothetical protein